MSKSQQDRLLSNPNSTCPQPIRDGYCEPQQWQDSLHGALLNASTFMTYVCLSWQFLIRRLMMSIQECISKYNPVKL